MTSSIRREKRSGFRKLSIPLRHSIRQVAPLAYRVRSKPQPCCSILSGVGHGNCSAPIMDSRMVHLRRYSQRLRLMLSVLLERRQAIGKRTLMKGGGLHNLWKQTRKLRPRHWQQSKKCPVHFPRLSGSFRFCVCAARPQFQLVHFREIRHWLMSADRMRRAFGHSFNGMPDNYKRLAASVINGNVAPATGFGDHAIAERRPSYSLPATIATSAPTPAGSWLNWMIRNGEVERIAEGNRIALSPATPAFEPDAVHSPDGYFIGNYPPASPAVAPPAVPSFGSAASQDRQGRFDSRFGSWGSSPANSSGRDQSKASVFDTGAPPIRYLSSRIIPASANRRDSIGSTTGAFSTDTPGGLAGRIAALAGIDPAKSIETLQTSDGATSSEVDANRRFLTRRIAGQPRASVFDTGASPVPFVPANDSLFPDTKTSFADRFGDRASSGFNDGPGKRTSDAFSPSFYNDELPEAWLFRALTGRLR